MDFWSRLVSGTGDAPSPKKAALPESPQQRLVRFKALYSQLLQTWNKVSITRSSLTALESIEKSLNSLASLLEDETWASGPRLCTVFAASTYIYKVVSRIALGSKHDNISREAVAIFAALVGSDAENLLDSEKFAETLITLVSGLLRSIPQSTASDAELEAEILELIFNVIAKLKQQPELVPAWFKPDFEDSPLADDTAEAELVFEAPVETSDFPLCRQFMGRLHHEGKTGDFARTGVLYVFETASRSPQLEQWIITSDLSTVLVSGLGALYSQLSRKVSIAHPDNGLPLIIAISEVTRLVPSTESENFYSAEFQASLARFESYLVFWQDVLNHSHSEIIETTLMKHFRVFFLEQILYPSLLQSSDMDGGSVAVLIYCCRLLEVVYNPDVIDSILHYLLALPSSEKPEAQSASTSQSPLDLMHGTKLSTGEDLDPTCFSLLDLVLVSARSTDRETVIASLRLVTVMLSQHHNYAVSGLIRSLPLQATTSTRSTGALEQELELLISMAEDVGGTHGMDEAYANSLKDAMTRIECHHCSKHIQHEEHPSAAGLEDVSTTEYHHPTQDWQRLLDPDDPLLQVLVSLMRTFFMNDVETNLALTGVITHLASCPCLSLESWLITDPARYKASTSDSAPPFINGAEIGRGAQTDHADTEAERIAAFKAARRQPAWSPKDQPLLIQVICSLQELLRLAKDGVPEFEGLVASRKRAFQGSAELEDDEHVGRSSNILSPRACISDLKVLHNSTPTLLSPARRTPTKQNGTGTVRSRAGDEARQVASSNPFASSPHGERTANPLPRLEPDAREVPQSPFRTLRMFSPSSWGTSSPKEAVLPRVSEASPTRPPRGLDVFEQKIRLRRVRDLGAERLSMPTDKESFDHHWQTSDDSEQNPEVVEVSLSQIVTNVTILQEFLLELAAIVQVRAAVLNNEIGFV